MVVSNVNATEPEAAVIAPAVVTTNVPPPCDKPLPDVRPIVVPETVIAPEPAYEPAPENCCHTWAAKVASGSMVCTHAVLAYVPVSYTHLTLPTNREV